MFLGGKKKSPSPRDWRSIIRVHLLVSFSGGASRDPEKERQCRVGTAHQLPRKEIYGENGLHSQKNRIPEMIYYCYMPKLARSPL